VCHSGLLLEEGQRDDDGTLQVGDLVEKVHNGKEQTGKVIELLGEKVNMSWTGDTAVQENDFDEDASDSG